MNRRSFLGTMLAMAAAPAIVRAESLMKCTGIIVPPRNGVWVLENGSQLMFGAVKNVQFWGRQLSDEQVRALTEPVGRSWATRHNGANEVDFRRYCDRLDKIYNKSRG